MSPLDPSRAEASIENLAAELDDPIPRTVRDGCLGSCATHGGTGREQTPQPGILHGKSGLELLCRVEQNVQPKCAFRCRGGGPGSLLDEFDGTQAAAPAPRQEHQIGTLR
jgi:hypothetical protein